MCDAYFSTFNREELNDSYDKVSQIYPQLVKEESLENGNPEVHQGQRYLM